MDCLFARERRELLEEADGAAVGQARSKWGSVPSPATSTKTPRGSNPPKPQPPAHVAGALLMPSPSPVPAGSLRSNPRRGYSCLRGVRRHVPVRGEGRATEATRPQGGGGRRRGVRPREQLATSKATADVYLHGSDAGELASWAEAALLRGESVLVFAFCGGGAGGGVRARAHRPVSDEEEAMTLWTIVYFALNLIYTRTDATLVRRPGTHTRTSARHRRNEGYGARSP